MQAFIALPSAEKLEAAGGLKTGLRRRVCGIPLLVRVLETAARSGATRALLVRPDSLPEAVLQKALRSRLLKTLKIETTSHPAEFNPESAADWKAVESRLDKRFLWLPWNAVTDKRRLSRLVAAGEESAGGARFDWAGENGQPVTAETPVVVAKDRLAASAGSSLHGFAGLDTVKTVPLPAPPSAPVTGRRLAHEAEDDLLRWSGKDWDGMFSKFNRRLCWPMLRTLWHSPFTPNMVTFAGLAVVVLSGYFYAQGHWLAYVAGGLLYFASVLFDEMDGMLARLTFRDSAFGCWLETWVDYASYFLVYGGITIGLYRQSGPEWLIVGGLLLFGAALAFITVSNQRRLATEPDKPHEYQIVFYEALEENSGDPISRNTRQLQFLVKKAVMCHHILVFSALGLLKIHFVLSALGANLVWILGSYLNRFFRSTRRPRGSATTVLSADQSGGDA